MKVGVGILLILQLIILLTVNVSSQENLELSSNKISKDVINNLKENPEVEVIVELNSTNSEILNSIILEIQSNGFKLKDVLLKKDSFVGSITQEGLEKLMKDPRINYVYFNRLADIQLQQSLPLINATTVWNSLNYTGRGQTVCVIDTGINWSHPDLGGCKGSGCKVLDGYDYYNNDTNPMDDHGHGTYIAGIVAAKGGINGTAPDAKLIAMKVCGPSGMGCPTDAISNAITWCINNRTIYNISVISISLGNNQSYENTTDCPVELINDINNAYLSNISVVIASGNYGFTNGTAWPSCRGNTTSVGNVYDTNIGPYHSYVANCTDTTTQTDKIVCSSNRGKNLDLFAPGCYITSTDLSGYGIGCGTSSAAPHVSGTIALMLEKNKTLTPDEILSNLKNSGKRVENWTRVNAYNAIKIRIDQCDNLDVENGVYSLIKNISSNGTCLNINANNVTINGQYNTISGNLSGYGVYNSNKGSNIIQNITIKNFGHGVYFFSSTSDKIIKIYNILSFNNSEDGVNIYGGSNHIILNGNLTYNKRRGIYLYSSKTANLTNIHANNNSEDGIFIYPYSISGSTLFYLNNISTNDNLGDNGIHLDKANNTYITNLVSNNFGGEGVYFYRSANVIVRNGNISSANLNYYSINNTFINVTYNSETVSIDSNLTRTWYLDVKVNGSVGNINQANVTGRNVSGSVQFSALTNSTGMITRQEVIEYINVGGVKNFYTNYNITASKTNYSTMYQLVNMSMNRYLTFNLMPNKIIFMTNSTFNGNLSGVSGADQLCMDDSNKPASGIYKALVGTSNRQISGSDWVLKVNTTYTRVNTSITIDTTNSQKWFTFNLENPITTDPKYVWTGLYENGSVSIYNCNNWFGSSDDGTVGDSNMASSDSIYYTEKSCPLGGRTIYCVEQ